MKDERQAEFKFGEGQDPPHQEGAGGNFLSRTRRNGEAINMKKSSKVKGEASYDSNSRKVMKFVNTPMPVKDYEGKLLPGWTIEKAAGKGKLPYLAGKVEALNSAVKKGGKNRTFNHRFFLNTTPNANGNAHIDMGDQVTAYAKAIDTRLKCSVIPATKIDDKGVKTDVMILDPDKLLQFIEGTTGTLFKFRSKNEQDQKDKTILWPKVGNFIEAEEGEEEEGEEGEEEEEEDSEEDESEDEEEDEEADEDEEDESEEEDEEDEDEDESEDDEDEDSEEEDEEDDEEEEEAPKKTKSKVKQGPAPKKKGKK